MQKIVVEQLSGYPQKLVDLQWLEDELHDLNQDEISLNWNRQRKCVEHRFSQDWEVEYCVLEHWSEHVGARFDMTDDVDKKGYYCAYIYR
jgi:hypothetical protein